MSIHRMRMRRTKTVKKVLTYPYRDIGARVTAMRHRAGLTQVEFGAAIGMSAPHTWRIEHGVVCPSLELLQLLKDKFGADPSELLFGVPSVHKAASNSEAVATYAKRRGLSPQAVALLKQVPFETLGIVGKPTDDEIDRVRMLIETNQALGARRDRENER